MNTGHCGRSPSRRASRKCPISWQKISTTMPTPNVHPQISAYPPIATKTSENFARKPSFAITPSATTIGAVILLSRRRQSVPPRGWTGS